MKWFAQVDQGIDFSAALAQIDAHPDLWGVDPERTDFAGSPHYESKDIWLRFRPRRELNGPESFGEPHWAEFYPAWHALPALHPIVFHIMWRMHATYLGGILLTRMPPGSAILPHVDRGWHPEWNNCKVYAILRANEDCINFCADERVIMRPGDLWAFENRVLHGVRNGGDTERVALIVTMRRE